jgi:hypothetical protein
MALVSYSKVVLFCLGFPHYSAKHAEKQEGRADVQSSSPSPSQQAMALLRVLLSVFVSTIKGDCGLDTLVIAL